MYTRSQDDVLPAARRREQRRERGRRRVVRHRRPPAAPVPAAPPPPATASPAAEELARPQRPRGGRVLAEVLLSLGALLGVAVTGVTVVAAQSGLRPLVVRSGSMEPTIPVGSMVLVERIDATEIEKGDVVAVQRPDRTRVTHRVVKVVRRGDVAELTLKGDANEDADPQPVPVRSADRLVRTFPEVGRAAGWLASAQGGFALGCLTTLVATRALRRRARPPADDA